MLQINFITTCELNTNISGTLSYCKYPKCTAKSVTSCVAKTAFVLFFFFCNFCIAFRHAVSHVCSILYCNHIDSEEKQLQSAVLYNSSKLEFCYIAQKEVNHLVLVCMAHFFVCLCLFEDSFFKSRGFRFTVF